MEFLQEAVNLNVSGLVLRGMLHRPQDKGKKVPLVLMLHGFTGNKTEHKFAFVRFSRLLAENNIAALRFDFSGSGESDGDFENMLLSTEIKEAEAIYNYALQLECADEVWLLGFSMGGLIASLIANTVAKDAKKLLLWSPLAYFDDIMIDIKNDNAKRLQKGDKFLDISGLPLTVDFIADIKGIDAFCKIRKFNGAVKIIHGEKDAAIPYQRAFEYQKYYGDSATAEIIQDADHCYSILEAKELLFVKSLQFYKG